MTDRIRNGWQWEKIRRRILRRDPLCVECLLRGFSIMSSEVDHRVPLFKGGSNDDDNLQAICRLHHLEKTRADMGSRPKGCDELGMPTDSRHWWNK